MSEMLPEICYTAGIIYGIFEGTYRGLLEPWLAGSAQKVSSTQDPKPMPELLILDFLVK